ncbi:9919_t:CDS:2, partial [Racocetra fulgida]
MEDDLLEAFTEIVIGNKSTSLLGPVFEKLQNGEQEPEALAQCVLDVIWYIDSTIIDGASDKATENDCRRNLINIVKYLHANNIVDTKSMKTKLDISLLESAGVVEEKTFGRRCVRINTAMLYKQQKYNLAREESEGYAKLICELTMDSEDNPHQHEIGLACALIEIGDFYHVRYVLYHLPEIEESIASCLRQMINVAIYDIYAPIAPRLVKRLQSPSFFGSWYKRWREGIPIIHSFSDLIEGQGRLLLLFIGPWLARDLILFTKIMRIAYHHLEESRNSSDFETVKNKWLDIVRSTIMPSIAMPDTTCGVIDELWNILKLFPYKLRFNIYAEWKLAYDVHKPLKDQHKKVSHETKKILKRITEENCREKGRELAKISHANPTIVFEIILKQIQAYGNMINSLVEACKYFTAFEYDILTYQMLEVFSSDRERLKDDGINISDWLKHLSEFCGNMCRKYEKMNLSSILLFIICRLKDRNSVDLCVLSQLITAMSGIKYEIVPSKYDVALMGTGEHLRNIKLFNRNQKNVRRNSSRLSQTLVEEGFAVKIAVLIAQLAQSIPYEALGESSKHLKSVVHRMDLCCNTYIQYVDFLAITIGMDEYTKIIPDIENLVKTYHLQMEYAFMLLRPVLNYKLKQYTDESSSMDVDNEKVIWQPPLSNIIEQVKTTLPSYVWNGISPQFFITFWQMSLYDLEFPQEEYRKAKNELLDSANGDKVRDKSKIFDAARQIDKDMRKHEQHIKNVKTRLRIEKDHWFSGQFTNRQDIITQFWQYCLFPRLITSADNAVFCAKFIETMHEIGTVNFSTLTLYDRIFADQVQPLIFTCSESEARNYGTFLQTILASLSKLHKNPQEYENRGKGSGIPGFQMKWSAHNRQPASISENDLLRYEEFRLVYYKWHSRLLRAFEQNLQSMEYFSVRNSIIALNTVILYFPAIDTFGKKLQEDIDKIVKNGDRSDIRTLALSYSAILKGKQQSWVSVRSFQKAKNSPAMDSAQHDERSEKGSKHDENLEKGPQKRDERSDKGSASPAQRATQSPVVARSGPLSNVRGAHPSSPSYLTTRASPRMQIHPLPDKPIKQERGQIRDKEHEREKEHERDRVKDRKDMQIERDKEIKKGDHHDRDKEISKKLDHYDRDKEREERDRKQEISRSGDDKKDPLIRNKERLMNDDPNKRTDHRLRDRDDKIKEKDRDKRDDRREERRDKAKEKERDKSRERERLDEDRDRRESDRGKRKHAEEPTIRRSRDNMMAQRFVNRDGELEQIPSNKRRSIEGISPVLRPPVKLNRAMEHNDFIAPMPGKSI